MMLPVRQIAIVGHEGAKFTPEAEAMARDIITGLCTQRERGWQGPSPITIISGRCPLGGVDVWAEEIAEGLGLPTLIFPPKVHNWSQGYKPRNIQIAEACTEMHVIVVHSLPPDYTGMRFTKCYHCKTESHVKSGACWTAHYARRYWEKRNLMERQVVWHILNGDGTYYWPEWRK